MKSPGRLTAWWKQSRFPLWSKIAPFVVAAVFGIIYAITVVDCVDDPKQKIREAIHVDYECPKDKVKLYAQKRTKRYVIYKVDVCGKKTRYKCDKVKDGCNITGCRNIGLKKSLGDEDK